MSIFSYAFQNYWSMVCRLETLHFLPLLWLGFFLQRKAWINRTHTCTYIYTYAIYILNFLKLITIAVTLKRKMKWWATSKVGSNCSRGRMEYPKSHHLQSLSLRHSLFHLDGNQLIKIKLYHFIIYFLKKLELLR